MVHRLRLRASTPGGAATNVGASTQVATSGEASLALSSTQVATSGGVAGASGATRGDPGVDARAQGDGHRCLLRFTGDVAWRSRTPVHTADAIAALTCWGAGLITRNAGADGASIPTPALDGWQCAFYEYRCPKRSGYTNSMAVWAGRMAWPQQQGLRENWSLLVQDESFFATRARAAKKPDIPRFGGFAIVLPDVGGRGRSERKRYASRRRSAGHVPHGVVQPGAAALPRLPTRFDIVGFLLQELLAQQLRQRGDHCDRGRVITGRGNGTEDVRLKANELFLMVNGLVTTRPCQSTSCM